MKILKVYLNEVSHRPLLNGLNLLFIDDEDPNVIDPNCLIGVNGSGKSQFLETLAEIFYYLDNIYRPINRGRVPNTPCEFEIEYSISLDNQSYFVKIVQEKRKGRYPIVLLRDVEGNDSELEVEAVNKYLPTKVIGYTSGSNETLSIPFLEYYDEYADHTTKRALSDKSADDLELDYDPRFYFMDYNTNKGVVIANLSINWLDANMEKSLQNVLDLITVKSIRSFQLIIQTYHPAARKIGRKKDGVQLTPEMKVTLSSLIKLSTAYDYDEQNRKHTLDFYVNDITKGLIKQFFGSAKEFYSAVYKLELLNNLIIDNKYKANIKKQRESRRILVKQPIVPDQDKVLNYSEIKLFLKDESIVNYLNLSDGEHQFLNVFGTILMQDENNTLFLFDEPETHFNPKWRREFVKLWNELTVGRIQDNFITTHSPFVVSDCKRVKVYIFKKTEEHSLIVSKPPKETYGASFDYILHSAFDLKNTLSEKSYDELKALAVSNSIETIQNNLSNFGESSEKYFLYQRIEELKHNRRKDASSI